LNGRGSWIEMFRLPLIYAAIAGLSFNLAQTKIPELLLQPIVMLGQTTIPIMLISLGYQLHQVESLQSDMHSAARCCASSAALR